MAVCLPFYRPNWESAMLTLSCCMDFGFRTNPILRVNKGRGTHLSVDTLQNNNKILCNMLLKSTWRLMSRKRHVYGLTHKVNRVEKPITPQSTDSRIHCAPIIMPLSYLTETITFSQDQLLCVFILFTTQEPCNWLLLM